MLTSELAYKNASSLHHSSYRLTVCSFDSVIFKMYERCANKITYKSGGIQFSFGLCGSASNIGSIYKQLKEKINILSSWKMTESSRPFWYAKKVNQSYSPQPCRHFWIWAISTHTYTHTHTRIQVSARFAQYNDNHQFYWDRNKIPSAGTGLSAHSAFVALALDHKKDLLIFNRMLWYGKLAKESLCTWRLVNENETADTDPEFWKPVPYFYSMKNCRSTLNQHQFNMYCMMLINSEVFGNMHFAQD